jgi:hypothetical protein
MKGLRGRDGFLFMDLRRSVRTRASSADHPGLNVGNGTQVVAGLLRELRSPIVFLKYSLAVKEMRKEACVASERKDGELKSH